jgi:RNA polymerase sigma-70 factor (ECF subfamily)
VRKQDADLARRAADGEAAARDELVSRYGPASFRCARSLGLGDHDAEDVAQEVMVKLLGSIARYDPSRAAIGTLVYRMTVNTVHDFRGRPARREVRGSTTVMKAVPNPRSGAEAERLENSEMRSLIVRAVRDLPGRQRQVCVLHDLEGLSIADTASTLEITPTNVRVHLTHARRALRERLGHLLEG